MSWDEFDVEGVIFAFTYEKEPGYLISLLYKEIKRENILKYSYTYILSKLLYSLLKTYNKSFVDNLYVESFFHTCY